MNDRQFVSGIRGSGRRRPQRARRVAQGPRADLRHTWPRPACPASSVMNPADMERLTSASDRKSVKAKARPGRKASSLARAINLPCELTDAEQVGAGQVMADGRSVGTEPFTRSPAAMAWATSWSRADRKTPLPFPCFSADATHAADIARGGKVGFLLSAPRHQGRQGDGCCVDDHGRHRLRHQYLAMVWHERIRVRWSNSEVSCADNNGYLLETPRVGPSAADVRGELPGCGKTRFEVSSHGRSAARPRRSRWQMFRDAIKQNGLACEPTKMARDRAGRAWTSATSSSCSGAQQTDGLSHSFRSKATPTSLKRSTALRAAGRDIVCQLTGR